MIDDTDCIHLRVRVRARAVYVVVECYSYHLFVSVWENAHPKQPLAQEAGIAVCSPPSKYISQKFLPAAYLSLLKSGAEVLQ